MWKLNNTFLNKPMCQGKKKQQGELENILGE